MSLQSFVTGVYINHEAEADIPKERLFSVGDPMLFGTGSRGPRELGVEGKHQHNDNGLAHGIGILTIARGLLHIQRQPQLRDDPPQQGMRD